MNKPKLKTCRVCKLKFEPVRAIQPACSFDCQVKYALLSVEKNNASIARKYRQDLAVRKEKLKSRQEHLKDAQIEFNKYIRLRDEALPCISCQRHHSGQYHAGHYRSVGSARHLRFNEENCHKQCAPCNNHLSGNIINYRINLEKKIGIKRLQDLESDNNAKHYTIDDVKAIKVKYKQLTKELNAK